MRRVQRIVLRAVAASLVAVGLAGCATLGPTTTTPVVVSTAPLSTAERTFLAGMAAKNMYEVEVSRLAARRATDPRVRAYAQMMVDHHEQANAELVALMSAKGVPPPKSLTPRNATKLHRLAALPPSTEFDRGYVRVVGIEDHAAAIERLERVRRESRDRDLRAWIDRTLPTLRRHRAVAQDLASTIAA